MSSPHLILPREWTSGSYNIASPSLCDLLPLAKGSPYGRFISWVIDMQTSARSSKSNHPQYPHLCFPAAKRSPLGNGPKQQISTTHLCTHTWESQRWRTPGWFPGLLTLWAVVRVPPPSLALSGGTQVGVWTDTCRGRVEMSISPSLPLSRFFLSLLCLPLPWSSPTTLPPNSSWSLICVFISFGHWCLCCM